MSYTDSVVSRDEKYLSVCREAVIKDEVFRKFKSIPEYYSVLEHVDEKTGQEYLDYIKKYYPILLEQKLLPKFKENDTHGSPRMYTYPETGNISPTTLRYMKVLGDIEAHIGPLDNLDIVEIGCGYGGQCKIIGDMFKFRSYTLIDLPCVVDLIEKYLKSFDNKGYRFIRAGVDKVDNVKGHLFISNYAFTECDKHVRKTYIDSVLNNCLHGYITVNYLGEQDKKELCSELLAAPGRTIHMVPEIPSTAEGNCIIVW